MRKCRRLGKIWDRFVLFYRNLLQKKTEIDDLNLDIIDRHLFHPSEDHCDDL